MKTYTRFLAASAGMLLAAVPFAQAGHLCLSKACLHALPDQAESCGSYQMWAPGNDVCGSGSYEMGLAGRTLEERIGDGIIISVCNQQISLMWDDGRPLLTYIDVTGGTTFEAHADNIEGTDNNVCTYTGWDCWEVAAFFGHWYWPDLPIC